MQLSPILTLALLTTADIPAAAVVCLLAHISPLSLPIHWWQRQAPKCECCVCSACSVCV